MSRPRKTPPVPVERVPEPPPRAHDLTPEELRRQEVADVFRVGVICVRVARRRAARLAREAAAAAEGGHS